MTCRQLGGPCDTEFRGDTADDIIKAQDRHLKDAVARDDAAHQPAAFEMKARWRNPLKGMGWYLSTKRAFAEQPNSRTRTPPPTPPTHPGTEIYSLISALTLLPPPTSPPPPPPSSDGASPELCGAGR